jgi:hypothetical protein
MISKVIDVKIIERQKFVQALREIADGLEDRLFSGKIRSNDDGTTIVITLSKTAPLH